MELTLINTNGNVIVHAANCADVARDVKKHGLGNHFPADHYSFNYSTKFEAWLDYNADFLAEGSGAWTLEFKPCCTLPTGEVTEFETEWKQVYA